MKAKTERLWQTQFELVGDRLGLFTAVANACSAQSVLYPGSYVDLTPSFVFESVMYVDVDKRAAAFFADAEGVQELISREPVSPKEPRFAFIHADYQSEIDLEDESFDLLVSLYAGFISEPCTRFLRVGGTLLVNPSHGDAAMASIDPRYELSGVVVSRSGGYKVLVDDLDTYLVPKKPIEVTRDFLYDWGRGIGYTKQAFAYLFTRVE